MKPGTTHSCPARVYPLGGGYVVCGLMIGHKEDHQFITDSRYCSNCHCLMGCGLNGKWGCYNPDCAENIEMKQKNPKDTHQFIVTVKDTLITQAEYFENFKAICAEMFELTKLKNSDYAENEDAFANFMTIEQITGGRVNCETGIVVRLTDKLKRIGSLLSRPAKVLDEKITDTVLDMAVYSVILLIYLRKKTKCSKPS